MNRLTARTPVGSAPVARERLLSLLEHDRCLISHADLLSVLREEIYALVGRHAAIDPNKVHVMVARGKSASTLTVDIEVPFRPRTTTRRVHEGEGKNALSYR
ncbi:MAG TPA: cell division topological specificity factor MinE [Xanthobacteraceae bacterium]|nr:cell division topological specificity factor MinE [Xanthobacteraceae bacterium]